MILFGWEKEKVCCYWGIKLYGEEKAEFDKLFIFKFWIGGMYGNIYA
jgi:hypothetical protein